MSPTGKFGLERTLGRQLVARKPDDLRMNDLALGLVAGKENFGKLLCPAHACVFHKDVVNFARLRSEVPINLCRSSGAQCGGSFFDQLAIYWRHLGSWRAKAWRIGEDVQPGQVAVFDQRQRVCKHCIRFGRETRDYIGAECHIGP